MTEQTGFPAPEQNRAEWLAANPGAQPVTPGAAAEQVAAQLGEAAPGAGVSGADLGAQMAAAGAQAGLPHEAAMDQLMEQIKNLSEQVGFLRERDRQREQAAIAALGEPIAQRYANAVRDHLKAKVAAHPGSDDHFRAVIADADKLSAVTADTISRGANDFGQAAALASRIDRFLERGHKRTAPHMLRQVDLSTVAHHLEYFSEEVVRLTPGVALALTGA